MVQLIYFSQNKDRNTLFYWGTLCGKMFSRTTVRKFDTHCVTHRLGIVLNLVVNYSNFLNSN